MEYTQKFDICYSKLIRAARNNTSDNKEFTGKRIMIEEIALQAFVSGISSKYHLVLSARNPSSYEEASDFALREEKRYNYHSFNRPNDYFPKTRIRQLHKNPITCHYCKRPGHLIKYCQERLAYNNNQSVNRYNNNYRGNYQTYRRPNNEYNPNNKFSNFKAILTIQPISPLQSLDPP